MSQTKLSRAEKIAIWSELSKAAYTGDVEKYKKLLHPDLTTNFISISKHLTVAIQQNQLDFVHYILGGPLRDYRKTVNIAFCFHDAAKAGNIPIMNLIERFNYLYEWTYKGYLNDGLSGAVSAGQIVAADFLIDKGASFSEKTTITALTACQTAASHNQLPTLIHLLTRYPHTDAEKQLAANFAAESGHLPVLLYMEAHGFIYNPEPEQKEFIAKLHLCGGRIPILEHWLQDNKPLLNYLVNMLHDTKVIVTEPVKAWLLDKHLRAEKSNKPPTTKYKPSIRI